MKLITTLLIASAFAAHANWFTELFETEAQRIARTTVTDEQRAEFQRLGYARERVHSYAELQEERDAAERLLIENMGWNER